MVEERRGEGRVGEGRGGRTGETRKVVCSSLAYRSKRNVVPHIILYVSGQDRSDRTDTPPLR